MLYLWVLWGRLRLVSMIHPRKSWYMTASAVQREKSRIKYPSQHVRTRTTDCILSRLLYMSHAPLSATICTAKTTPITYLPTFIHSSTNTTRKLYFVDTNDAHLFPTLLNRDFASCMFIFVLKPTLAAISGEFIQLSNHENKSNIFLDQERYY